MKEEITKSIGIIALIGLGIYGCGGGGGGGSSSVDSTLTEETIDQFAQRFIDEGLCTETGGIVFASERTDGTAAGTKPAAARAENRDYEYDESYSGSLGGTMDIHTEHIDGTTTRTYTMYSFANMSMGKKVTADGVYESVEHGVPGDYGPIVSNKTAETKGAVDADVEDLSRATDGPRHYSFSLSGYNRVYAKEFGQQDTLAISGITVEDKDKGKTFRVDNVKSEIYGWAQPGQMIGLIGLQASYTDPDIGTIKVSAPETIRIEDFSDMGGFNAPSSIDADLELEATDGTKGRMRVRGDSTGTLVQIYTRDAQGDETLVTTLDCESIAVGR